jgi:hypothetical protein
MTAIVLPDVDRATIDAWLKRVPNFKEIELPKVEDVGRNAEVAIDRLLGRSRAPVWPWIAAGVGLVAVISAIGAYFAWFRTPTWRTKTAVTSSGQPLEPTSVTYDSTYETEMAPDTLQPAESSLGTASELN